MSAQDLVKLLKAGDSSAFKVLVTEYQQQVMQVCYGFVRNQEDAEDLAQEVFVEVYRSVNRFREEAKLSTWLYRIATTKSLDFIRKQNRQKRIQSAKKLIGLGEARDIATPGQAGPFKQLVQQEQQGAIQHALGKLPENQRIAFTLSKIEGLGYKEIAKVMGSTVSSVESLLHRAKKNLKKHLHHYYLRMQD